MKQHIETSLSHIAKYAPFSEQAGASHFPIYNTGTFDLKKQDSSNGNKIYDYTRSDNPTREMLENLFKEVENGAGCVCTHTGIASVALLFETVLKANSSILVEADCYGGTFRLLKIFKEKYNVTVHFANFLEFDKIEEILKNNNIDANSIIIEVTERKFMMDRKNNKELLNRYKKLGVEFALDDFGTGYSNLSYLSEMPFNTLKIDRSFVEKIGKDKKSEEIIKATIAIAKALELHTIAEGIETKEQFEFLDTHGCEAAQGYYLSKPKAMDSISKYISGENKFLQNEAI